jgi:hypothetical protein
VDNGIVLLSVSSGWMDVLASDMTESRGYSAKAYFSSWSSADASSLSAVSQLSIVVESPLDVSPDGDDATWP